MSALTLSLTSPFLTGLLFALTSLGSMAGCGYHGSSNAAPAVALTGTVLGGRLPVSGASIQLYAAGVSGTGSAAQPLLTETIKSNSNGSFTIPAGYGCPTATSQIFITAHGGNAGSASAGENQNLSLMAVLGSCNSLSSVGSIAINEVTTIGSVWPLAAYMTSPDKLGSEASDASFLAAVTTVPEFINVTQGTSPGMPTAVSYFSDNAKLDSLADLIAGCVQSSGGSAGDGSACGSLFKAATTPGSVAPTDTLAASINIAHNPGYNVAGIFDLVAAETPFQPVLGAAPPDWSLALRYNVAAPAISLASGNYAGPQSVTISDATPGAMIYYTTDGTAPSSTSPLYTGPLSISSTATVQAIALLKGSESTVAAATLTIAPPNAPHTLAFLQQPAQAVAGALLAPVKVVVEDSTGNVVTPALDPVTLTLVGNAGLAGTLTATPLNGVATFGDLSVSTAGTYMLQADCPGLAAVNSASFTIQAATPNRPQASQLVFRQQPSDAVTYAAIAPAVQLALEDSNGDLVTDATNAVTVILVSNTGIGGTLWTALPVNGIVTFSDLAVSTAGNGYTLSASSPGLATTVSTPFAITTPVSAPVPTPFKLAFLQQPSNALTGATISPAIQVAVEDNTGAALTSATNPITISLTGGTGLGGTLTVTPQNGIATFGDLSISNPGGGYTMSASAPGLASAVSASFAVSAPSSGTAPAAVKLAFLQQPSNALTQAMISPAVTVVVEDANGNPVTGATGPITVALSSGTGLGGAVTAIPVNGVASFNQLTVSVAGSGDTLVASSPLLSSATSSPFTISAPGSTAPVPVKLGYLRQPGNAVRGSTMLPVQVAVQDSNGNTVGGATNLVTLALTSGSGLSGTLTVAARNGMATFSNLTESTAGTYALAAATPGLSTAISTSFVISPPVSAPVAAKLAFLQQPTDAIAGVALSPSVTVLVEDTAGNVVANATNAITMALTSGSGLSGTLTVAARNGMATFSNLAENAAGTYALAAATPGLSTAISTSFVISPPVSAPVAAKLAFLQQPTNAVAGVALSPSVTVLVEDTAGNVVANATSPVTVALTSGSGLSGTLTVAARNGMATFSNLTESAAGTYALAAATPGLSTAISTSFVISPPVSAPVAAKLALLQQPTDAVAGVALSPSVSVLVEDGAGNVVANATNPVTVALTSGSGLSGTLTAMPQNGVVTFHAISESYAGTYQLAATSGGLAAATSASFTITSPVVTPTAVKLAFVQQPSNAAAGAAISPAVTVAIQDNNGNTVPSATNPITLSLTSGAGLTGTLTAIPKNGIATFSTLEVSQPGSYTLSATSAGLLSSTSSSFTIDLSPVTGTTYYLSPTGNDANNGLSLSAPWLSPNHALKCGDVISAAPGNYSAGNFNTGRWGTVTCPSNDNVAWLKCATFDTCKIATSTNQGMWIDASYWGVSGWEVTVSQYQDGGCFIVSPRYSTPVTIHHVIVANNIANGCMAGGISAFDRSSTASFDYVAFVGNIAYNAAQGSGTCTSGINVYQPIAADNSAGTHIYIAGNFSFGNVDPAVCAGGPSTDGEGIIVDTLDFSQGGGTPYTQQVVVDNNIVVNNGSFGALVFNNQTGSAHAPVFLKHITSWGNLGDSHQTKLGAGEITLVAAKDVQISLSLSSTVSATGMGGHPIYALAVENSDASDIVTNNSAAGVAGNNTFLYDDGLFSYGTTNAIGVDPHFVNPRVPGAPTCGGFSNVPACMTSLIANFKPTTAAAVALGYQQPSPPAVVDPLFPKWLCGANLPSGLISMGCN